MCSLNIIKWFKYKLYLILSSMYLLLQFTQVGVHIFCQPLPWAATSFTEPHGAGHHEVLLSLRTCFICLLLWSVCIILCVYRYGVNSSLNSHRFIKLLQCAKRLTYFCVLLLKFQHYYKLKFFFNSSAKRRGQTYRH